MGPLDDPRINALATAPLEQLPPNTRHAHPHQLGRRVLVDSQGARQRKAKDLLPPADKPTRRGRRIKEGAARRLIDAERITPLPRTRNSGLGDLTTG